MSVQSFDLIENWCHVERKKMRQWAHLTRLSPFYSCILSFFRSPHVHVHVHVHVPYVLHLILNPIQFPSWLPLASVHVHPFFMHSCTPILLSIENLNWFHIHFSSSVLLTLFFTKQWKSEEKKRKEKRLYKQPKRLRDFAEIFVFLNMTFELHGF